MSLDNFGSVGPLVRCGDARKSNNVDVHLCLADSLRRSRFRRCGNCRRTLRSITATPAATAPSTSPFATFLAVCVRYWWNGACRRRRCGLGCCGLDTRLAWRFLSLRARFGLAFIAAIVATSILSLFALARLWRSGAVARRCLCQRLAAALVTPLPAAATLIMRSLVSARFSAATHVGERTASSFASDLFGDRFRCSIRWRCGRKISRLRSKPCEHTR